MKVTIENYTSMALRTWGGENQKERAELGIIGELGEVAEVLKKHLRGDFDEIERDKRLLKEFGDVFYYIAIKYHLSCESEFFSIFIYRAIKNIEIEDYSNLPTSRLINWINQGIGSPNFSHLIALIQRFDFSVIQVMQANIDKLSDRAKRNKISGDGDER